MGVPVSTHYETYCNTSHRKCDSSTFSRALLHLRLSYCQVAECFHACVKRLHSMISYSAVSRVECYPMRTV
jgi:hypothetical protein